MSHSLFVSIARRQIAQLWQLEFDFLIDNCADPKLTDSTERATRLRLDSDSTRLGFDFGFDQQLLCPMAQYILKFSSFGVAELQMQISEFALLSQPRQQIQLCRHNGGEQRAEERGAGTYAVMPKLASKNYCQNCLAINSDKYQSVTPPVRGNTSMPKQKAPNLNEHLCKVSATCHSSSSSSNNGAHEQCK